MKNGINKETFEPIKEIYIGMNGKLGKDGLPDLRHAKSKLILLNIMGVRTGVSGR